MAALLHYFLSMIKYQHLQPRQNKYNLTLPAVCHATLDNEKLKERPVFIIGDVHGCFQELMLLLEAAQQLHKDPFVIFVGDIINKGPQNLDVLRLVQQMVENEQALLVRGNHEEAVIRELLAFHHNPEYQLPKRYSWLREMKNEDFKFLQELPYTLTIPSLQAIVVHAGIVPGMPLERQKLDDLTHMRNIIQEDFFHGNGFVGISKIHVGEAWASLWPGPEHVYFGHDARRGFQQWPHATGLDTGCLYGHKLTGVFIGNECQPVCVDALCTYVMP